MSKPDTSAMEKAVVEMAAQDIELTVQLVTGMFVALTLEYMKRRGYETDGNIKIEGGEGRRAITIHAEA